MSAVFFDMDGTLVDSETLTEPAVVALCNELGIDQSGWTGISADDHFCGLVIL